MSIVLGKFVWVVVGVVLFSSVSYVSYITLKKVWFWLILYSVVFWSVWVIFLDFWPI